MTACPRRGATVYHPERKQAFPALCGRWGCRRCGGRKRDKLVRRGLALKADGMLSTTISDRWSDGLDATSPEALAFLQKRERVFRRHIERVLGGFAYLWVVEFGEKNHRAHRHYLVRWRRRALVAGFRRGFVPRWLLTRLQDFAKSAGLGRPDWQPCPDDGVLARYVAKYVTKTVGECEMPRRFRRFGSNEHYEEPKEPGWRFMRQPVENVLRFLEGAPAPAASFLIALLPDAALAPPIRLRDGPLQRPLPDWLLGS